MAKKIPTLLEAAKLALAELTGNQWSRCDEDTGRECRGLKCDHAEHRAVVMLEAAIERHKEPTVYVHVNGGAVTIGKGVGVEVEVIDFDTDGAEPGNLCDGHNCEVHEDHKHEVYKADESEVI